MVGSWRRDVTPLEVCACGHSRGAHRIDLKRQACDFHACDCKGFAAQMLLWSEHRTVAEPVAPVRPEAGA